MFDKLLFILAFIPQIFAYNMPLRMSMSEKYLSHLQNLPLKVGDISSLIKSAPTTDKSSIEIENIYLNIYKMSSLFFNRKAQNIYFTPSRELTELYYFDNKELFKIPQNTTIVSKNLRNFIITELHNDIDGILF